MINEHKEIFEKMRQKILNGGERPLDVIEFYSSIFEKEKIGKRRLLHCLVEYVKEKNY
jgi:hypothetical protein